MLLLICYKKDIDFKSFCTILKKYSKFIVTKYTNST